MIIILCTKIINNIHYYIIFILFVYHLCYNRLIASSCDQEHDMMYRHVVPGASDRYEYMFLQEKQGQGVIEVTHYYAGCIMHLSMYCPRYRPTGMGWGFDLYEINSLSPWIKCPLRTVHFCPVICKYDQTPWSEACLAVKMRSNPHLLPVGGVGGAILW